MSLRRFASIVVGVLLVTACNMDARANLPVAAGQSASVDQALGAARACGIFHARIDPLDDTTSVLLIDQDSAVRTRTCLSRWTVAHAALLDATLLRQVEVSHAR